MAAQKTKYEEEQDEGAGLSLHCLPDDSSDVIAGGVIGEGSPLQYSPT